MANKTHAPLPGSNRGKSLTAFQVGKVDPKEKVIITIGLRGPELPGVDNFVVQTMKRKELLEKFGTREDDVDNVKKCLKNFGLKVEEVSPDKRSMRVSGTAKAIEAAFKPKWAMMRSPSEACIAAGREQSRSLRNSRES